jgi:hypothetical protein
VIVNESDDATIKSLKLTERKSYDLFRKYFPSAETSLFKDLYELILVDMDISHHEFNI